MKANETNEKLDFSKLPQYAGALKYIRTHPGAQAVDVAKATDADVSTTRKRLTRLQAEGVLKAERFPRAVLFYISSG